MHLTPVIGHDARDLMPFCRMQRRSRTHHLTVRVDNGHRADFSKLGDRLIHDPVPLRHGPRQENIPWCLEISWEQDLTLALDHVVSLRERGLPRDASNSGSKWGHPRNGTKNGDAFNPLRESPHLLPDKTPRIRVVR